MISKFSVVGLTMMVLAICSSKGHPVSKALVFPRSSLPFSHDYNVCPRSGNSDLYGLGIRVGMYLQTLSTMLTETFVWEMALDFRDLNAIFLLALLIAVLRAAIQNQLTAIDGIVMLKILWCYVICAMSKGIYPIMKTLKDSIQRSRSKNRELAAAAFSRLYWFEQDTLGQAVGLHFRVWISGVVAMASVYFWYDGFDKVQSSESCRSFLFFFTRLDASAGVRTFYKVASIPLILFYGYLSLYPWIIVFIIILMTIIVLAIFAIWAFVLIVLAVVGMILAMMWAFVGLLRYFTFVLSYCAGLITSFKPHEEKEKSKSQVCGRNEASFVHDVPTELNKIENGIEEATNGPQDATAECGLPRVNTLERTQTGISDVQSNVVRHSHTINSHMRHVFYKLQTRKRRFWDPQQVHSSESEKGMPNWIDFLVLAVCISYWVWSIIGIELTLKWNSTTNVYSINLTAQLIPFVIGVVSWVQVAWRTLEKIDDEIFRRSEDRLVDSLVTAKAHEMKASQFEIEAKRFQEEGAKCAKKAEQYAKKAEIQRAKALELREKDRKNEQTDGQQEGKILEVEGQVERRDQDHGQIPDNEDERKLELEHALPKAPFSSAPLIKDGASQEGTSSHDEQLTLAVNLRQTFKSSSNPSNHDGQ